jgi:drug/metabolite transporter (DMT)-like permease
MVGLDRTPASSASLLLNLEGLGTLAIAWIIYKEHVDRRIFLGAMAILTGALALSWPDVPLEVTWGALAIAGACLAWAIDNNLTRKLAARDPVQIAAVKGLAAGAVNLVLAAAMGSAFPSVPAVGWAALVGFVGYGVSLALFVLAMRNLGAARASAYFSTGPFIGAALAIPLLGEPVTVPLLMAAVLMGWGVWIHLTERHAHAHRHAPHTHEHRHSHDAHHRHHHDADTPPGEPHTHVHRHDSLEHSHTHHPDLHHRHDH